MAVLERAHVERASDVVERQLFEAIVDGRIPPGSALRLKELSEQLGTSMMPIRAAIARLAALDLVEIKPHKGARVRELTRQDLVDTYFTRMHLECLAVFEAAARFSESDRHRAVGAMQDWKSARHHKDRVAARDAHERFHFGLYEASGRPWLVRSILPSWRNAERYRESSAQGADVLATRATEHRHIVEALSDGDALASVSWMATHLHTSVRWAARTLTGTDDDPDLGLPGVEEIVGSFSVAAR